MRAERLLSLLLVLFVCFLVGAAVRTRTGRAVRERLEVVFFERLPGYDLVRSLTRRLAGDGDEEAWKPALAEIEEALVPAFIIEELADGRLHRLRAVGAHTVRRRRVYILEPRARAPRRRPLHQAIRTVSRWGSGSKDLVAAMESVVSDRGKPVRAADR